jgi:hypothetical protein
MTEINNLDIEKALKCYNSLKMANSKYSHSDKGKERRRAASATYYQKMKLIDPEFMQRQSDKAKERYHRKKNMAIELLPDIQN